MYYYLDVLISHYSLGVTTFGGIVLRLSSGLPNVVAHIDMVRHGDNFATTGANLLKEAAPNSETSYSIIVKKITME